MQTFFGWINGNMAQEYISTSRSAIVAMANTLGNLPFDLSDPEVEVVVGEEQNPPPQPAVPAHKENKVEAVDQVEKAQEASNDFDQDFYTFEMEEDPEMYEAVGIPVSQSTTPNNTVNIQKTIQSAISAVPALKESNVMVKVVIVNTNNGSVNF